MTGVRQAGRAAQNRGIALFRKELGCHYLGGWTDRDGTGGTEEKLLTGWLA